MIKMQIGSKRVEVDGAELYMDVAPMQINDSRTMVPIRAVSEGMGLNVDWDEETKTVTIYGRKKYFETADDAAFDWAMHWNAMSIALFKEMGAIIYKDDKGYYWNNVIVGKDKEVYWATNKVHEGVAFIHSHSGGKHSATKSMSEQDYVCARKMNRPLYMVDSGGCLYVYYPDVKPKKQRFIKEGAPKDARWMDITESAQKQAEYFAKGYHDLKEYDFGFKADFYNKLYMKGLSYMKEGPLI